MKLALTGGIAEGKSTVLGYIAELGFETISSDEIAREVFASSDVQSELASLFGVEPPVARALVRERTFENDDVRRALNRITHPRIVRHLRDHESGVFEVPLLIESCLQGEFDRVWVVTSGAEEQLRRLVERTGDMAESRRMLTSQIPTRAKCAFADRIVRTNANPDAVRMYVHEAVRLDLGERIARR